MGDVNSIRTLRDYSKPSHEGYKNTIKLPVGNNVVRDKNAKESWALFEDLALYDNESWNDPRDFAKPVKEISLPQDVSSTSECRLIELENQVQRLMEAHLALKQSTQVNKITTSCKICNGPQNTKRMNLRKKVVLSLAKLSTQTSKMQMKLMKKLKAKRKSRRRLKETEEEEEDDPEHFENFPTMKELRYHEWILKNPWPLWNFTYECDFMVLEDTTSVIDHYLGLVVFGKPFMEATGLVYNKEKRPDNIPPFVIESDDDDCEKTTT
nr:MAK10-like protein [Tanacetum cinerariifolium]